MSSQSVMIILSSETYAAVKRASDLEGVTVATLIEDLVKQHVEYVEEHTSFAQLPRFSLDEYELQRDPGETEEGYQARLHLFF